MPTPSPDEMFAEAVRLHQQGRIDEAAAIYKQILQRDPNHLNALQLLGVASGQLKRPDLAVDLIRRAIAINPNIPEYHFNLGVALTDDGRLEEAIAAYHEAIRLNPHYGDAWQNIAEIARKTEQLADTIAAHRNLIRLKGPRFDRHHQLALALERQGSLNEAATEFAHAIQLKPDSAEARNNFGMLLNRQRKFHEAIAQYREAIRLMPEACEVYNNLGNALCNIGRFDEAMTVYEQALRVKPDLVSIHQNIAISLTKMGRPDEAVAAYERALKLAPDSVDAHWSLAFALLLTGDFERGWPEHEWRLQLKENISRRRHANRPRWDGSDLKGKTILLHAEQGYGDTIQFVRYVPMVQRRGGRVLLECPEELVRLFKDIPGVEKISPRITEFDVQCPLPSLPLVFGTRLESIPNRVPYLKPDSSLVETWSKRLGAGHGRPRIGLAWAGRATHLNDRNRSISLEQLTSLLEIDADFYSLQKGPAAEQIAATTAASMLIDHTEHLQDFADTAALMANLDLVISIDTAVVHLAGAIGKPVWVMLPFSPDWRWMMRRSDSVWYPTARLFRQPTLGDWSAVIEALGSAL